MATGRAVVIKEYLKPLVLLGCRPEVGLVPPMEMGLK